jgi:serine/threonine protein phosphatase PrpC
MMIYTFTEAGDGHVNEDAIAHRPHTATDNFALCALADGQGGRPGGGIAAQAAVLLALDAACAEKPETLLSPMRWLDVCNVADRGVAAEPDAGYCTLVALVAAGEWVVGASSGDSAAALILEHSAVILTDRQHKNPPVGSGAARFEAFSARPGMRWRVLVISDGVWKYVGWEKMIAVGRSSQGNQVAEALRREVLQSRGLLPDDFSVILIESKKF